MSEAIIIICAVISLIFNCVQQFLLQRKSIALAEFSILEKTCNRQREDINKLNQEIGHLKERTDLQPLIELLTSHNSESNMRFDKALQIQDLQSRQLEANTRAIETLITSHREMLRQMFPAQSNKVSSS
jgi:hypothetical protein